MVVLFITNSTDGTGAYDRLKIMGCALVKEGHRVLWLSPGIKDCPYGFELIKYDLNKKGDIYRVLRDSRENIKDVNLCVCISEIEALRLLWSSELAHTVKLFFQRMDTVENFLFHAHTWGTIRARVKWRLKAWGYSWLCKYVAKRMDVLAFQTHGLRDTYLKRVGLVNSRIEILSNNCDISWNASGIKEINCPWHRDGLPVVMVLSNMQYIGKGIKLLLDAFDIVSKQIPIRLALVGKIPPEHKENFLRRIKESPYSENISFTGFVPKAQYLLPYADLFCAPGYLEACSNSMLEAMATGMPIIASDIYAHKFLLEDERLLFKAGDSEDLAFKLEVLVRDKNVRDANMKAVSKQAEKFSFDWERRFVSLCEDVVNNN